MQRLNIPNVNQIILIYHYFIPKNIKQGMGSNYDSENVICKTKKEVRHRIILPLINKHTIKGLRTCFWTVFSVHLGKGRWWSVATVIKSGHCVELKSKVSNKNSKLQIEIPKHHTHHVLHLNRHTEFILTRFVKMNQILFWWAVRK